MRECLNIGFNTHTNFVVNFTSSSNEIYVQFIRSLKGQNSITFASIEGGYQPEHMISLEEGGKVKGPPTPYAHAISFQDLNGLQLINSVGAVQCLH